MELTFLHVLPSAEHELRIKLFDFFFPYFIIFYLKYSLYNTLTAGTQRMKRFSVFPETEIIKLAHKSTPRAYTLYFSMK